MVLNGKKMMGNGGVIDPLIRLRGFGTTGSGTTGFEDSPGK